MLGRWTGEILIAVGMILALAALLIDPLRGLDLYLATEQIVALIVGIVIAVIGLFITLTRPTPPIF